MPKGLPGPPTSHQFFSAPKPPPKPKPAKVGPYTKGYKPPKPPKPKKPQTVVVRTRPDGSQSVTRKPITQAQPHFQQHPTKPPTSVIPSIYPKAPAWMKPVNPNTRKGGAWPAPYLKPELQMGSAQRTLRAGGSIAKAEKAGRREMAQAVHRAQVQTRLWEQQQQNTPLEMFHPFVEGAALGKAAISAAAAKAGEALGIHPGDRGLFGVAHEGLRPTPGVPGFAKPLMPIGRLTHGVVSNLPAATESQIGPDLIKAVTGHPFSNLGLAADLAMLTPVGKLGEAAKTIAEATKLAEVGRSAPITAREAASVLKGVDRSVFRQHKISPAELARLITKGQAGRYWYENSGHAIRTLSGGNLDVANKLTQLTAIYSASRDPWLNTQLAHNAYNEFLTTGKVSTVGTGPQIKKANLIMQGKPWEGMKTHRFYGNILEDSHPELYHELVQKGVINPAGSTQDIWMARTFGLKTDRPSPREYAAMEDAMQRLAKKLGWKPKQVQAALWIAKKAEAEGTSIEQAGLHFGDAIGREVAHLPFEAVPGLAHPELHAAYQNLTRAEKLRYGREKAAAVGQYLHETNVYGTIGNEGVGVFEGKTNPGWSAIVGASRGPVVGRGIPGKIVIGKPGRDLLNHVTATIGHALHQDAGAWFKPMWPEYITRPHMNGIKVTIGKNATEKQMIRLDQAFRDAGHNVAIVHAHDGIYLLNLDIKKLPNAQFQELAQTVAGKVFKHSELRGFAHDSNYIEREDYAGHLEGTFAKGRPDLHRGAALRLQEASAATDAKYLGKHLAGGGGPSFGARLASAGESATHAVTAALPTLLTGHPSGIGLGSAVAASALRGAKAGERELELPGAAGRGLVTGRSPALAGLYESAQERNLQRVMAASRARPEYAPGYELAGKPTRLGQLQARAARRHVARMTRDESVYSKAGMTAEADWLRNVNLSDPAHMALKSIADNTSPTMMIAANERRITRAQRALETLPARIHAAEEAGNKARVRRLRLAESLARDTVDTLPHQNEWLRQADQLVAERPIHQVNTERYPTHPDHTGTKMVLREDHPRAKLSQVWDAMVRQGHLGGQAELKARIAENPANEDAIRRQFEQRVHQAGRLDRGAAWRPGEEMMGKQHLRTRERVQKLQKLFDKSWAQDQKRIGKGSMPKQPMGFEGAMSSRTRYLRGELNRLEDRLSQFERAYTKRTGLNPADVYGTRGGIRGAEDWKGGTLYYPSADELVKAKPSARGTVSAGSELLPFAKKGEAKKSYSGSLRESGRESHRVANLIGQQSLSRQVRDHVDSLLAQARQDAMRGVIPMKGGKVDPNYVAVRLHAATPPEIIQEYRRLVNKPSAEFTASDAQALHDNLQALKQHLMPEVTSLEHAKQLGGDVGYVHKALVSALADEHWQSPEALRHYLNAYRNASEIVRDMLIYTKFPGHIPPRLASNEFMPLFDAGSDMFKAHNWTVRLQREDPALARWLYHTGGRGSTRAYTDVEGGVASKATRRLSHAVVTPIELAADRLPRMAALGAMAIKQGKIGNYKDFAAYLERMRAAAPGSKDAQERRLWIEAGRKAGGEYDNLRPWQHALSNFVFLTRWLVASSRWTVRTMTRHPLKSAALGYLTAKYAYNAQNPIWNRFNIAGHNIQTAVPFSTPFEIGERARETLGTGSKTPALESLLGMASPTLLALESMLQHRDIESGRDIKGWAIPGELEALVRQTPIGALIGGKGSFTGYRLPKFLAGNWLPISGPSGPGAGGGTITPSKPLSGARGSITTAQRRAIEMRIQQAEARAKRIAQARR
jgi:hypothetical protein